MRSVTDINYVLLRQKTMICYTITPCIQNVWDHCIEAAVTYLNTHVT